MVCMHPVVRVRRIVSTIVGSESFELTETVEKKRFYWHQPSHSAWPWRWRANNFETWKTESLTQRCICVGCQLNSDQALTSDRVTVTRRVVVMFLKPTTPQVGKRNLALKPPRFLRVSVVHNATLRLNPAGLRMCARAFKKNWSPAWGPQNWCGSGLTVRGRDLGQIVSWPGANRWYYPQKN